MKRIGIDFDNTIVSYDRVFAKAAAEWGHELSGAAPTKAAARDRLRSLGREETWIELQGYVYGSKIREAEPFPGVLEFFRLAAARGAQLLIVSHKTRYPFRGPRYDLHEAAREWLARSGLAGANEPPPLFLELTKEAKAARIAREGCQAFIDDLPEFLGQADLPSGLRRILFDPEGIRGSDWPGERARSWGERAATRLEKVSG